MQGTKEWFASRAGKVTGSCIKKVMTKGKGITRQTYMMELLTERITGEPMESVNARSLAWGNDVESFAREAYEIQTGNIVEEVDFIDHPSVENLGCSPDGLINGDGGIEIKCPINSSIHLNTILNGMPEEHVYQVQFNMWVCKRKWWDFVSYDPRMPEHLRLYVQRIEPDQEFLSEMMQAVSLFLKQADELYQSLQAKAA